MRFSAGLCLVPLALSAFSSLAEGVLTEAMAYCGDAQSYLWMTATASPAKLSLDWPAGAVRAELTVVPGVGKAAVSYPISDTTLEAYDYVFALPTKPTEERVETFTITYYDGDDHALATASAKLGIVLGTANGATVPCLVKGTDDVRWQKCKTEPVLPIPEQAANLRLDGEVVAATPDAPGWWQALLPVGPHSFSLSVGGENLDRDIYAAGCGFLLRFR